MAYRFSFIVLKRTYRTSRIFPLEVTQILEYMQSVFCTRSIQNKYLEIVLRRIFYSLGADNLLRPAFPGNNWDAYTCVLVSCMKCLHDLYLMP
jgi:hypothetical protein